MNLKLIDGQGELTIITLADAKAHLGIEGTNDDTRLTNYLKAIRDFIEAETNVCWTAQTWIQETNCFPTTLGKSPVNSVLVQYYDTTNHLQTLNASKYQLVGNTYESGIYYFADLPATYQRPDAVLVTMSAGVFPTDLLPERVKQLCRLLVGNYNEHREGEVLGIINKTAYGIDPLIRSLRGGYAC